MNFIFRSNGFTVYIFQLLCSMQQLLMVFVDVYILLKNPYGSIENPNCLFNFQQTVFLKAPLARQHELIVNEHLWFDSQKATWIKGWHHIPSLSSPNYEPAVFV